jgi:peptidoglycan/xylan/chitin deacetylase (PgdA/CDA1 family)
LTAAGFSSGSLDDLKALPPGETKKAVITFDDGFSSVLDHGLDVLARRGFRAIQFLVAGFIGGRNEWDISKGDVAESLMDEGQARAWLAAGHEIGSHSNTHQNLRHLDPRQAREEISGSKKALEDRFGAPVKHFCYPFGSWNESVRDLVGEAGYHTACSLVFGVNTGTTPRLELRRIEPLSTTEMLSKVRHRLQRKLRERTSR